MYSDILELERGKTGRALHVAAVGGTATGNVGRLRGWWRQFWDCVSTFVSVTPVEIFNKKFPAEIVVDILLSGSQASPDVFVATENGYLKPKRDLLLTPTEGALQQILVNLKLQVKRYWICVRRLRWRTLVLDTVVVFLFFLISGWQKL